MKAALASRGCAMPDASQVLAELMEGNTRFRVGRPGAGRYDVRVFRSLAAGQSPKAAVVTCADSRVAPEIVFDQPLGSLLVSRVPGNVACESAKWMVELAVGELHVPLVLVVGHTGCRAIQQVLDGEPLAWCRSLQADIREAARRAKVGQPSDFFRQVVLENALLTVARLERSCATLRQATATGAAKALPAVYELETGRVVLGREALA